MSDRAKDAEILALRHQITVLERIDPAPSRTSTTSATFLRGQAEAIIAADLFETATLTGTRLYVLALSPVFRCLG